MICPKCGTPTLHLVTEGSAGLRLDRCTRCGGTWLDYGELAPAAAAGEPPAPRPHATPAAAGGADERSGPCPRCGVPLRQALSPDGLFHVDRCLRCGGMYLDRGELAAIAARHLADDLDRLLSPQPGPPHPGPGVPRRTGLGPEDRAVLARAAELAARFPEAADFLRAHLDGTTGR